MKKQKKSRKIQMSKIQWYREWLKAVISINNITVRNEILRIEKARLMILKANK